MRDLGREEIAGAAGLALGDRVRAALKAVLEQILEEEMAEHVGARHRERVATR